MVQQLLPAVPFQKLSAADIIETAEEGSDMPVWRDYNPTNDLVFKFVFGRPERKNVTLAFINDVLGREGNAAFVDLE